LWFQRNKYGVAGVRAGSSKVNDKDAAQNAANATLESRKKEWDTYSSLTPGAKAQFTKKLGRKPTNPYA
jgi:hypothetical protein